MEQQNKLPLMLFNDEFIAKALFSVNQIMEYCYTDEVKYVKLTYAPYRFVFRHSQGGTC
ncbi:hypothetical protein SAMN05428978_100852 [Nitrosomonas sp. Nm34]|nr:hypothetical protein SAMN05428978_100852 [Nitrosomonas sp. Nm34]